MSDIISGATTGANTSTDEDDTSKGTRDKGWWDRNKPQLFKDVNETIKIATNLPQTIQNQMTIFLYGLKDISPILKIEGSDDYDERNDSKRIRNIVNELKKSPLFTKHMKQREYGYNDHISSEGLWQIIQEEVIAKIIDDFMRRSIENSR